MKRYLLFGGDIYDCGGGAHDFHSSYDHPTEAVNAGKENFDSLDDWYHVFDCKINKMIATRLKKVTIE